MRNRERGIGNLPFIAVLVLFVIALALFFMKQDEADTEKNKRADAVKARGEADQRFVKMIDAYKALKEVVGLNDAALNASQDDIPKADAIKKAVRDYLNKVVADITKASEATMSTKNYTVQDKNRIVGQPGDTTTVRLYTRSAGEDAIDVKQLLEGLPGAMEAAAKMMVDNNGKFDLAKTDYDNTTTTLKQTSTQIEQSYKNDVKSKQTAAEAWKDELDKQRTSNETLTTKLDTMETDISQKTQKWEKQVRDVERDRNAWKNRAIGEKKKNELALKEDPADGAVLHVSNTLGTLWIDLGTKHKLSRGTRFTVWRPGKGNVRENVAVVQVIKVDKTRAETRVIKRLNPRVPPTKGMNVSNPFFDPKGTLKIYIYGDLRNYPTDVAAKRLAASGAIVSRSLDDTVNVIVLGEPPRTGDEAAPEDEAEAAAAEKKQAMDRSRRLNVVMQKAVTIGAIVVTEDQLATFIDY